MIGKYSRRGIKTTILNFKMNIKEIEQYCENIRDEVTKQREALKNAPKTKPLIDMNEVHTKGVQLYAAIQAAREENEKNVDSILSDEKYSQEYKQKIINELNSEFEAKAVELSRAFINTVQAAMLGKKNNLSLMMITAPTQEHINLLTSLQMRFGDVTEDEFTKIAPMLVGNYNAFKTLQKIANDCGFKITPPPSLDFDKINKALEWAEEYLQARITDFTLPWKQMSFDGRHFFGSDWDDLNYRENAVKILDDNVQLQTPSPIIEKAEITPAETELIEEMFAKYTDLDELKKKVKEAAETSEEIRILLLKHPAYKDFIAE